MQNRRSFLRSAVLAGAACSMANGLRADTTAAASRGTPMPVFRCRLPGVDVTAVCDIQDAKINAEKKSLARQKKAEPKMEVVDIDLGKFRV